MLSRTNSGEYRHYCEVIEKQETNQTDRSGQKIIKEVVIGDFFCDFENKTGNMLYGRAGDSKLAKTTHKISYRYMNFPELTEEHLLRINGQTFKIEYIDNLDNMNDKMEVFVQRENLRKG